MNSSINKLFQITLGCLLGLSACAQAERQADPAQPEEAPAGETFQLENFRWAGKPEPARTVRVVNPFGDIRARAAYDGKVLVSAMIQKIGSLEDEFEVQVGQDEDAVFITVEALHDDPNGRVDMAVLVPPGMLLDAQTFHGLIKVKKYKGDVVAKSESGEINLDLPGYAQAMTGSGPIVVQLRGTAWAQPLAFRSASGDVKVAVPADADLALRLVGGGGFTVDLPDEAFSKTREDASGIEGRLGAGGTALTVESGTGHAEVVSLR